MEKLIYWIDLIIVLILIAISYGISFYYGLAVLFILLITILGLLLEEYFGGK